MILEAINLAPPAATFQSLKVLFTSIQSFAKDHVVIRRYDRGKRVTYMISCGEEYDPKFKLGEGERQRVSSIQKIDFQAIAMIFATTIE